MQGKRRFSKSVPLFLLPLCWIFTGKKKAKAKSKKLKLSDADSVSLTNITGALKV
jgi:hypothetical protein